MGINVFKIMKFSLLVFLFLLNTAVYAQLSTSVEWRTGVNYESGDTVFYDKARKLTWKDFKGLPDNKSIAAAITSSGFGFTLGMRSKNSKAVINILVNCFFNKERSWVKPGMANDYALLHEQHHFDITYIWTCSFIKKLRSAEFTMENYDQLLDKIYGECYDELGKMQNDYDGQTKNGQLKNIQAEWNIKIDKILVSLATD